MSSQQVVTELNSNAMAEAFNSSLFLPSSLDANFEETLRYVLGNPGSLIRPNLIIQMATAYGLEPAPSQTLAVALEYFHTASLLFDDLPCMDNALERRGVPCTHLIHGEESAILAALALINRAYALLWRAVASCPTAGQSRALSFVEQCLGLEGLLNGQSLDLHFSSLPRTLETTDRVARGKTVSMIRLTLVLPAILSGADNCEIRQIERISLFWGLGYQIVDDLKDLLQSATQAGKTTARDALLGHPNVAALIGVDRAVYRLTRLINLGDRTLDRLLWIRPGLYFLKQLRVQLQTELTNVMEGSQALLDEVRS